MAAPTRRIIIDTDPGVDDVLAILLALSATPEELEVMMLSVTYGNVGLQDCLRNLVTLFNVVDKEIEWRKTNNKPIGFGTLLKSKPLVAVGAEHPLMEDTLMADYFHGADGLHGVHEAHPHLTPADTWRSLFNAPSGEHEVAPDVTTHFTPSTKVAHKEMLRLLRENPADTISIVAIGPLTNVALAAAEDPETFLRAKELVVMGGAVSVEGNITPVAEFNCYADAVAAARVYALTSPTPASTMPTIPSNTPGSGTLSAYPDKLSRQLKLSLFPLDITTPHELRKSFFADQIRPSVTAGSPLATWMEHILSRTMDKIESLVGSDVEPALSLHDPLTIWYLLTESAQGWRASERPEDIRIETGGQWTRGMHVVDRRNRQRAGDEAGLRTNKADGEAEIVTVEEVPGDTLGWLSNHKGNRINRVIASPGEQLFAEDLMKRIFG